MIRIVLPGIPIPRKAHAHSGSLTYDPQKEQLTSVRNAIMAKANRLLHHPVKEIAIEASRIACADNFEVSLYFGFPFPKNFNRERKNAILWQGADHNVKPDCDNLQKFYFDALKGLVFPDDAQISCIKNIQKKYDLNPRTVISIKERPKMSLDEETQGILSKIHPEDFVNLTHDINELIVLANTLDKEATQEVSEKTQIECRKAAFLLSKMADQYAKPLLFINKKFPGYWKNAS